jgi:hypothetical protein
MEHVEMVDLKRANQVRDRYEDRLRRLPDVVGVGIGGDPDNAKIIVLVKKMTQQLARSIPKNLDGVPVELVETGVIEPR